MLLKWLPTNAPIPPTIPPMMAVTSINKKVFGRENISATLAVRIESPCTSLAKATINHNNATPRKPLINDEIPFEDMIKLIKNPATATVHQAPTLWNE